MHQGDDVFLFVIINKSGKYLIIKNQIMGVSGWMLKLFADMKYAAMFWRTQEGKFQNPGWETL